MIDILEENMEEIMEDFEVEDPEYSYEVSSDYSEVTYKYDENVDPMVQTKVLLVFTTNYALKGILENNNSEWSVTMNIVNCHTEKTVASGTLPEQTISFTENDWKKSYE